MGKAVDLTGQRFGLLTVLSKSGVDKGRSVWHVRCDCGTEDLITRPDRRKSCGCLNRKDLAGKTFGKLTANTFEGVDDKGKALWSCSCSCGLTTVVRGSDLTSGRTKSCGCNTLKHGCSDTPEYRIYKQLIKEHDNTFRDWMDFLEAIGGRPTDNHRISKKDPNQPHGPTNTYWRSALELEHCTHRDLGDEFLVDFGSLTL
jgi:hypothetical protein